MKFVVVGLGSMGRRRIRLLKQISSEYEIVGVDNNAERCKQAEEELSIKTDSELDKVLVDDSIDGVIISTSPLSHAAIIKKALLSDCNVFTELNLVADKYQENISLAKEKDKVLFLSSTFLYRSEIQYIQNQIKETDVPLNYNYHVGQYLPDWHPWESINDYFVGDSRTNGCRELFAIELPWIIKTFGEIETFEVISSKNTKLPVQYNDNYLLLLKHKNGNKGVLAVDVISRKAVRNLEVYGEELYITWDGTPAGLKSYDYQMKKEISIDLYDNVDKQDGYASFVIENAYRSELETFISLIKGEGVSRYTFEEDYKLLSLIDDIESR
jgi:predicted dehydrogenase